MITEKGKEYIARNFGVNNCYALEEVVPCTVYTEGAPNERVLDTSTILFLLVTEVADWVSTAAGKFTLGDLIAANDGSYISMMEALGIEAYCIAGEPPVTPPYTPPVTPPVVTPVTPPTVGLKDFEIVNPSVNCDSYNCESRLTIKNNSNSSTSVYMRLDVDGTTKFKRSVYLLRGTSKAQTALFNFAGISDGYHNLTIAVGKDTDTDTYTHRFLVGEVGIEPPAAPPAPVTAKSLSAAEFVAEIRRRGTLDLARIPMIPGDNKWFRFAGQLVYRVDGGKGGIALTNPGKSNMFAAFSKDGRTVTRVEKNWAMARIAELPFTAAPVAAKITKAGLIEELKRRGAIDTAAISTVPRENKWYMYYNKANYHSVNFEKVIEISNLQTRNPPTQTTDIALSENRTPVSELDRGWVLSILAELPFTAPVTPSVTPLVTPPAITEPSTAIKAWIVANYGDGTRVTTDGWRKLNVAKMANTLAPLPSGYTKPSITEGVVLWAKANPNWEIQTICGWISSIGVTNLTEDHGLYVYNLAIGWTTLANSIYDMLSPKPSRLPTALATEDNGLGVYDYAIGWKTIANTITGCNF